ncbi:MAG: hypothetical protein COC12_05345 [Rhodobacteraceae bacterium]|nr:MAG: hypothetical protein COC12_05345 [Paracoccaceae bacterium]
MLGSSLGKIWLLRRCCTGELRPSAGFIPAPAKFFDFFIYFPTGAEFFRRARVYTVNIMGKPHVATR